MPKRPRILVVDDDEDTLGVFATILRDEGLAVWVARNGTAAMEVAEELGWDADAIVVDLGLGEGPRGDQFVAYWRTRAPRDTPVIVVSGLERAPEFGTAIRAVKTLRKPVSIDDLVDAVRAVTAPA